MKNETKSDKAGYNRFLLLVAGLGGLLYGVDVGIIAGALPYLEATFKDAATGQTLNAGQLSFIVAAVLLGSVISTLFAGMLADLMGRKKLMAASGVLFVVSIPMIALAHGYGPLVFGRLLQGISGGLIGVVIPLYLAECLGASSRGKGTGIFQWLLTLGIVVAALIAMFFSYRVDSVKALHAAQKRLGLPQLDLKTTRHTFVTRHLLRLIRGEKNAPTIEEVQRWLGHAKGSTEIHRTYAKLVSSPHLMD